MQILTIVLVICAAVGIDYLVLRMLRKRISSSPIEASGGNERFLIFGEYSPALTWFQRIFLGKYLPLACALIQRYREGKPVGVLELGGAEAGINKQEGKPVRLKGVWILLLLAAAIPPALVVMDRWLFLPDFKNKLNPITCKIHLFCQSRYPSYFVLILPALVCVIGLFAYLYKKHPVRMASVKPGSEKGHSTDIPAPGKRQVKAWVALALITASAIGILILVISSLMMGRIPGAELAVLVAAWMCGFFIKEGLFQRLRTWFMQRWRWLVPYIILTALILFAYQRYYTTVHFNWLFAVTAVLFAALTFRRLKDTPLILWVILFGLMLSLYDINAWWASLIGDEYEFFFWAKGIAFEHSASDIVRNLFKGTAAYGQHPYFSSLIQAAFLRIFGANSFGWRGENFILCALSGLCLYGFLRTFIYKRTALLAALILVCSHYLLTFGRIGYNNLQALFALTLALWAGAVALRRRESGFAFTAVGAALGLCFYVYPAGIYTVPVIILLLLVYFPPLTRKAALQWLLMIGSALALLSPLFLQLDYWQTKQLGTFLASMDWINSTGGLAYNILLNLVSAAFSFLYLTGEDHMVVSSLIDPVTGIFAVLGLLSLLVAGLKHRFSWFLFTSFIGMLFAVGATHGRDNPPLTRMFMLLPWFAIFAAFGVEWSGKTAARLWNKRWVEASFTLTACILLVGSNLIQANVVSRNRSTGLQSYQTLYLRILQQAVKVYPDDAKQFVFITTTSGSSQPMQRLTEYYPLQVRFTEVVVTSEGLPREAEPVLTASDSFLVIEPWMVPERQALVAAQLEALEKEACDIKTTNDVVRFQLWYPPGENELCR